MSEKRQQNNEPIKTNLSGSPATTNHRPGSRFYLWAIALAIVLAILLHESLFGGKGLMPADGIFYFLPWNTAGYHPSNYLLSDQYELFIPLHEFMHQQFLQGRFPLWNPYMDCGAPTLAGMQGALLFPINLLFLPLDPFYAAGLAAFLKLFLAGLFTMLYLRLLGAGNSGAFLSGLVFSLSGFMICWLGHPQVNSALCLPMLLYFIEKSFQSGASGVMSTASLRAWAGFAVAFACMILGGHQPTAVQITIFSSIYFVFRLTWRGMEHRTGRMMLALCAASIGLFIAAPQLLPFLEYYHQSSVAASAQIVDRASLRLPLNCAIFYLFPHLSGNPSAGFEDTMKQLGMAHGLPNFNERTGYVGILPWLFALYAIITARHRMIVFYASTLLISLLAIYGIPPFSSIFETLPVYRDINSMRLLFLAGFAVAILAGLGWDKFQKTENCGFKLVVTVAFWIVIGFTLACYWHQAAPHWPSLGAEYRHFLKLQFLIMGGSFLASLILILLIVIRRPWLFNVIGLVWIATDLLFFGMGYNPAIPHDRYYPTTPAIDWLKRDHDNFRILGAGRLLVPDTAQIYGLKDARGYDCVTPRRYEELITGKTGDFFFYSSANSLPVSFPLLGIKYVMTFNSLPLMPDMFDLVYSNEVSIYQYHSFHERSLAVFNCKVEDEALILAEVRSPQFNPAHALLLESQPDGIVSSNFLESSAQTSSSTRIILDQPEETDVEASMPQPGFLLLEDNWFPGWSAEVNGSKTPILRADYNFRAVELPAGKSFVRFVYKPESFRIGIIFALFGIAIIIGVILGPQFSRKQGVQ